MSNSNVRRLAPRARTEGFTLRKRDDKGAHRWPFVYAHGVLETRMGTDIVCFNLPRPARGVYEVRGNTESALVFVFTDDTIPTDPSDIMGLVVLISDREGMEYAMRLYMQK